jgi:hypothetical protein
MEVSQGKRLVVIIGGMICAYFLAGTVSAALLARFRLDAAAGAVAGFLLFAILFLLILKGIGKVFGTVFFPFNLD